MPPRKKTALPSSGSGAAAKKRKTESSADDSSSSSRPKKAAKKSRTTTPSTATKEKQTQKQTELSTESPGKLEKPIMINRAPVLELWSACVAHFLHPDLKWTACLSIGGSIATLTAITKGRAIGTIAEPDTKKDDESSPGKDKHGSITLRVMGFPMKMQGDTVIVKGKPRPGRETSLARRFGEDNLGRVKEAMLDALESWKGDNEEELDRQAFHMYERFRPDVAKGQQGWGRKGELHIPKITSVVTR